MKETIRKMKERQQSEIQKELKKVEAEEKIPAKKTRRVKSIKTKTIN